MRIVKLAGAAALVSASGPAIACDLDGMGEHRFFAFANMARQAAVAGPNAQPAEPAPAPRSEPTAGKSESGGGQAEDNGNSDESSKPSAEQTTAPNDGPSDGATFR